MGSSRTPVRATRTKITAVLATVIRIVGWLAALILVAHIVLTTGEANPANGITTFVASWADRLDLGFRDLFTLTDARLRVVVNYGLPALVWVVASYVVASLVRRVG
ncbi:MAG: hypothetical protein ACRDSM_18335 [Pseudonocardiaceae bacterium]